MAGLEENGIVIGRKGTAGMVWLQEQPCWASDTTFYLEWKLNLVHYNFVYYSLLERPLSGEHARTTLPSLLKPDLENYFLYFPPLPEQRAIIQTLQTIQEAKEARQRELELERERKAVLMQYLFTHGTRDELRKQTELGEIPESWEVVKLGSISSVVSGGTPSRTKPEYWNGCIPWVKTGEINYKVIVDTEERITKEGLKNSSARVIPKGTLLMAMYGQGVTRGRVATLGINAAINQACAAIVLSEKALTNFVFHFLAYSYERIRDLGHGANQKNLNALLVKSIVIVLPKVEEQQEIANILQACDTKISALQREIELLDELFRAMLEELMTGRVSVMPLVKSEVAA